MKLKSIKMKKFKRFTDLTIQNIPETAKLVVLVGPNGCGKSSLFEAFNQWYRYYGWGYYSHDTSYLHKESLRNNSNEGVFDPNRVINIDFYDFENLDNKSEIHGKFYFRSAYRNEPDFSISSLSHMEKPSEETQENLMRTDTNVSENYQRLVSKTVAGVYAESNNQLTVKDLREKILGQIQKSLNNVFPDLELLNIGDPLGDGTFYFKKGIIDKYHYKNLSAGEKSAFDLILDLIIKQEYYPDAIFCIDEPEGHMHTSMQEKVLEELYQNLPEKSQLWIATHSIGMLKKAKELNNVNPNSVVFLDFDGKDFDSTVVMEPAEINKSIWNKFLELAFDDFAGLIAPATIVFCEGSPTSKNNKKFDQEVYSKIFQKTKPDVSFVSIGSCSELESIDNVSINIIKEVLKKSKIIKLVDLDDRSKEQVKACHEKGIKVLSLRHIEAFLLADEMIKKLCNTENKTDKISKCLEMKNTAMKKSAEERGNPRDDVKSASGEICNGLKHILGLTQCGNNTPAFLRDTMAPLLTPDMALYTELENCIFGE
ncbi:MAG: AAA family ATPase [Treponema sp.]